MLYNGNVDKLSIPEKISVIVSCITLFSVLFAGTFWVYKTNELPTIVDSHEKRISNIEKQLAENNTKTELIYQSVLEIRRVLMYQK